MQLRMSKKIAQLTKVIFHLNTKAEDHETDLQEMADTYESEIETMLRDAAAKINTFKGQLEAVRDDTRFQEAVATVQLRYEQERQVLPAPHPFRVTGWSVRQCCVGVVWVQRLGVVDLMRQTSSRVPSVLVPSWLAVHALISMRQEFWCSHAWSEPASEASTGSGTPCTCTVWLLLMVEQARARSSGVQACLSDFEQFKQKMADREAAMQQAARHDVSEATTATEAVTTRLAAVQSELQALRTRADTVDAAAAAQLRQVQLERDKVSSSRWLASLAVRHASALAPASLLPHLGAPCWEGLAR